MVVIEPELFHLNDEIQILCRELNITSLLNDIQTVKDNFNQISNDIREKFDRLNSFLYPLIFIPSNFSHKTAAILANDIKRNLAILEDTLGQCTNETRSCFDGDVSELKIQLEQMMVILLDPDPELFESSPFL